MGISQAIQDLRAGRFPVKHKIKSHPEPFAAVWSGEKSHEIRFNDRKYKVADSVRLMEWDPDTKTYPGRTIDIIITHIRYSSEDTIPYSASSPIIPLYSTGLKSGYVVFDFLIVNQFDRNGLPINDTSEIFKP